MSFLRIPIETGAARALLLAALLVGVPMPEAVAQAERSRAAPTDPKARLAQMQADPKSLQAALKQGGRVAAVCANCHGEGGVSAKPEVPNLAGQNPVYLLEQMRQFAEGQRRNEFMEAMIKAMSTEERAGAVLYYAAQSVPPRPAADATQAARGADLYARNCFRCHGTDGRGNAELARLAGQQGLYVVETLKRYRTGTGPRVNPLMADATRLLSDADIAALAAFVGTMR